MLYYGMSMKADLNGDSLYLSFALSSLVEIPGTLISYFLINSLGRRLLMSSSLLACAGLLLLNWGLSSIGTPSHFPIIIPFSAPNYALLTILLLCKMGATCVSNVGYIHVPEMMPTLLRTTASGYCGAVARVGSILCSYISLWLVFLSFRSKMSILGGFLRHGSPNPSLQYLFPYFGWLCSVVSPGNSW